MHDRASEIVEVANTLVGARYKHQGRSATALDCVGVPIYIAKYLGLSDWDTVAYGPRPALNEFNKLIRRTGVSRIPFSSLDNGDMVQISYNGAAPVHVGIIEIDSENAEWCIHAFSLHRKVTRDPVTPELRKTFVAAWRFPN